MASLMNSFLAVTKDILVVLQGTYVNFIAFFRPPPPPPRSKLPLFFTVKNVIAIVFVLVLILSACFAIWFTKKKRQKTSTSTSVALAKPNSRLALEDLSLLLSFLSDIRIEESSRKLESISIEYLSLVLPQVVQTLIKVTQSDPSASSTNLRLQLLENMILSKSLQSFEVTNFVVWHLAVAQDSHEYLDHFISKLNQRGASEFASHCVRQRKLVEFLGHVCDLMKSLNSMKRSQKIYHLRRIFSLGNNWGHIFIDKDRTTGEISGLPLPLHPTFKTSTIADYDAHIYKSAKSPLGLSFISVNGKSRQRVIYKASDDLRQDQLVMQLIKVMDIILKNEGCDACLTPYAVLATSKDSGMIECVPNSHSVADIVKRFKNVPNFLQDFNGSDRGINTYLDTFMKSCAAYCVISYLLLIGDRHLDNLMVTTDGHFFHIDFGFIMGADPKPFPPPMKLCKEMVEGMGGRKGSYYHEFRDFCCVVYNLLRRHSGIFVKMLVLMEPANMKDITLYNIEKFKERLLIGQTDEEAAKHMLGLVKMSARSLFPRITDKTHQWAQYWRD
eukprot:Phypoly_transcript_03601.p1 GENE.Phypoly_transcript_03601~~Phypoly_transcript_03601.p1  ORF type:complete len:569 (+),score=53.35 Phypoly_transcript_03601:37-1707(+)